MTTLTTGSLPFIISNSTDTPKRGSGIVAFGVLRTGALMFPFTPFTVLPGGTLQGVHFISTAGVPHSFLVSLSVETSPGSGVSEPTILIPEPVGTGTTRGVPFRGGDGATYYLTCTQTRPV